MARARKPAKSSPVRARKAPLKQRKAPVPRVRDYAAEYARRQARARAAGFGGYYEQRVARFQSRRPGASRAEARGHRSAADLPDAIRRAGRQGGYVSFFGNDRQADGTWRIASFVVGGDDGEREFVLGPNVDGPGGLVHLPGIGEVIDEAGVLFIGDRKYLQLMIEWVQGDETHGPSGETL